MLAAFGIETRRRPISRAGALINERIRNPDGEVTIAIVGKYTGLKDAYKSLIEALSHGGIANKVKVNLDWIESEVFEREDPAPFLEHVNGILVPGGFGQRGAEGKIRAAQFARERARAVFRHLLRHADGGDRGGAQPVRHRRGQLDRVRRRPPEPVVGLMTEWLQGQRAGDSARPTAISAAPCGSAPIRRVLHARQPGRRDLRHAPRSPSATATATRSTPPTGAGSSSTACASPACRRTACCRRSIEYDGPPLVHRRAVPPRAEIAPVRRRTRCSPPSSAPRWSRAGWCSGAGRPGRSAVSGTAGGLFPGARAPLSGALLTGIA